MLERSQLMKAEEAGEAVGVILPYLPLAPYLVSQGF